MESIELQLPSPVSLHRYKLLACGAKLGLKNFLKSLLLSFVVCCVECERCPNHVQFLVWLLGCTCDSVSTLYISTQYLNIHRW